MPTLWATGLVPWASSFTPRWVNLLLELVFLVILVGGMIWATIWLYLARRSQSSHDDDERDGPDERDT